MTHEATVNHDSLPENKKRMVKGEALALVKTNTMPNFLGKGSAKKKGKSLPKNLIVKDTIDQSSAVLESLSKMGSLLEKLVIGLGKKPEDISGQSSESVQN